MGHLKEVEWIFDFEMYMSRRPSEDISFPLKVKKKKKKTAKSGEEIPYTTTEKSKHIIANSLVHY